MAGHPTDVIFLTCDAFGVLPPVSPVPAQAMYHFISGYTAKVAGTEVGVKEPSATFSPCFGGPFLVWHPSKYAELLAAKMRQHKARVWLINTGWSGGPHGVGKRIKLAHTRAILTQFTARSAAATSKRDPVFGFEVITACPGVPSEILWPRDTWADKAAYDATAKKLAGLFIDNFKKYERARAQKCGRRRRLRDSGLWRTAMNWLFDLYETNYTAQAIAIVALVCMAGMVLGSVKVRGIGLGTAGVLFAGLLVGAVSKPIDHKTLEFVKELGLILFVFCIGLQLGPGFFASLRQMGLRLNVLAGTVVVLGAVVAVGLGWLLGIDSAAVLGLFSATTNTPSLGAAQQTPSALPISEERAVPGLAYAVSYPVAIIGIIATTLILQKMLRLDPWRAAEVSHPSKGRPSNHSNSVLC